MNKKLPLVIFLPNLFLLACLVLVKTAILPNSPILPLIALISGVIIFASCLYLIEKDLNWSNFLLISFFYSFLIHFFPDLYFFGDEWHVLQRIKAEGLDILYYRHNEHYLPLFWLWYWFIISIFGQAYWLILIVSILIHAAFTTLLAHFIAEVLKPYTEHCKKVAQLSALFFALSMLHSENLQWAFEQCIQLSVLTCLLAVYACRSYLEKGSLLSLFTAGLLFFAAPLFFGNSLSSPLSVGLLLLLYFSNLRSRNAFADLWNNLFVLRRKRLIVLSLVCALFYSVTAALYLDKSTSNPNNDKTLQNLSSRQLQPLGEYISLGTQTGTLVRGLGLYPNMKFPAARLEFGSKEVNSKHPLLLSPLELRDPEFVTILAGFLLSFCFLAFAVKFFGSFSGGLLFYLILQAFLVSQFLLPAASRYDLGIGQALEPRYQYFTLVGLSLFLCPILYPLFQQSSGRKKMGSKYLFALLLMIFALSRNFEIMFQFTPFRESSKVTLDFIDRMNTWKADTLSGTEPTNPHLGPMFIAGFSSVDELYELHEWLESSATISK